MSKLKLHLATITLICVIGLFMWGIAALPDDFAYILFLASFVAIYSFIYNVIKEANHA